MIQRVDRWTLPPFNRVSDYWSGLQFQCRDWIAFGLFHGTALQLSVSECVECWDDDTDSFREEGTLIISISDYVKRVIRASKEQSERQKSNQSVKRVIRPIFLGNIAGYGTAALVDNQQNVWSYNVPNLSTSTLRGWWRKFWRQGTRFENLARLK